MSTENTPMRGVTGEHTTNGTPHGTTSLTPFLAIENAREAVEFYREIFGARLVDATEMGGVLVHADLDFGQGHLQLGVPSPQFGLVPPPAGEEACYSLACTARMWMRCSSAPSPPGRCCVNRPPRSSRGTAMPPSVTRSGCVGR